MLVRTSLLGDVQKARSLSEVEVTLPDHQCRFDFAQRPDLAFWTPPSF